MSAALDLVGAAHTITADTTETYFTVTDSVGGGTLTMEAGSFLEFDDTAGAGFLSTSLAFTLTVTGTSTSKATIQSANSYPDYRWTLPLAATTVVATRCIFRDYTGTFSSTWTLNNPEYIVDPYTYATSTELANLTGTTYTDTVLHEILGQTTNEINARLEIDGITVSSASDVVLRSICLNKAKAAVMWRMIADGTRAGAINTDGGGSTSDQMALINEAEAKAEKMLVGYIKEHLPSTRQRLWAYKVNEHG